TDSFQIKNEDVNQKSNTYGTEVTMEPNYPVILEAEGVVMDKAVQWSRSRERVLGRTNDYDWELTNIVRRFQQPIRDGAPVTLPVIAYYGTGRLWLRKEEQEIEPLKPVSRLYAYNDCLDARSNEKQLLRWMKKHELARATQNSKSSLYEALKKTITGCIEECKEIWFDYLKDSIMVRLNNGQCLPAYLLSDGYRNMVAMVADIAYRMAILNPHLGIDVATQTPGIVLIDEIDLHLHPTWQRSVVADLTRTFPGVQFVATSHSPFIAQSLKSPTELLNLDKPETTLASMDISIEDIAEKEMNVPMPQKSERYKKMMDVATQYYKLLDEGKRIEDDKHLKKIKSQLDELLIPFSDKPAYQAFLQMKRIAAGLNETD
ncbi:MAG: AAA family ATPase, partial [bacterium]|nr:AAA family ATPase [bacterium]